MNATPQTSFSAAEANPYDVVDYPGHAFPDTHPARLAAIGVLHGLAPAPVERCRVLELGCGDAANLLPMAYQLPDSRFLGIDLAASPVARGRRSADELGLSNLALQVLDICDASTDLGEFDYIIAHGVYSWVPEPVRRRLLELCAQLLAPHGIAFISYLAQPGTQLRDVLRQFLLRHDDPTADPRVRIAGARARVRLFVGELVSADPFQQLLRALAREFEELADGAIFHDWLAPGNAAFRVTDFVAAARRYGLGFLGEAEYFMMCWQHDPLLANARSELAGLEGEDVVAREQLLDELRCRRFRQTLLCRGDVPRSPPAPSRLRTLAAASRLRPVGDVDVRSNEVAEFRSPHDIAVRIDHPVAKAALLQLAESWPRPVSFGQLLASALAVTGREHSGTSDADAEVLGGVLLACAGAAHAELTAWIPPMASHAGERPRASTLARLQSRTGATVATLRHHNLTLADPLGAALLRLLDGTRDRAALLLELERMLAAGEIEAPAVDPVDGGVAGLAGGLERSLAGLAQAALLEA